MKVQRASVDVADTYSSEALACPGAPTKGALSREDRRTSLGALDACLQKLEDAHERGEAQVSDDLVEKCARIVPELVVGMLIADAIELVFKEQERCLQAGLIKSGAAFVNADSWRALGVATAIGLRERRQSEAQTGSDKQPTTLASPSLAPVKARELTDQIKAGLGHVSLLLMEAHDGKAWSALGYGTWSDYVRLEFGLSRSRSYELLDHGRVLRSLASAAGMSGIPDISPFAAQQIKPHLSQLTKEIGTRSAGLSERQAMVLITDLVESVRGGPNPSLPDSRASTAQTTSLASPPRTTSLVQVDVEELLRAVERLAKLPTAAAVANLIAPDEASRLVALPEAARWLNEFAQLWITTHLSRHLVVLGPR